MRAVVALAILGLSLLAMPTGSSQVATFDLYLTSGQSTTVAGAELLSFEAPTATTASTHQFSPTLNLPSNTFVWASDVPFANDVSLTGGDLTLYFGAGAQVQATVTATLDALTPIGRTEMATATTTLTGQVLAAPTTLSLSAGGATVPEGSTLQLTVSVTGVSAAAQIEYDSTATPSAIMGLTAGVLDSDGDGFGDSDERRQGTDPFDANSWPGNPDTDNDGLNDTWENANFGNMSRDGTGDADGDGFSDSDEFAAGSDPNNIDDPEPQQAPSDEKSRSIVELIVAALLLLVCIVIAVFALTRRFVA